MINKKEKVLQTIRDHIKGLLTTNNFLIWQNFIARLQVKYLKINLLEKIIWFI